MLIAVALFPGSPRVQTKNPCCKWRKARRGLGIIIQSYGRTLNGSLPLHLSMCRVLSQQVQHRQWTYWMIMWPSCDSHVISLSDRRQLCSLTEWSCDSHVTSPCAGYCRNRCDTASGCIKDKNDECSCRGVCINMELRPTHSQNRSTWVLQSERLIFYNSS